MPIRALPLALLLLLLLPQAAAATGNRIIVKRDAGLTTAEKRDIRADADVRFAEALPLPGTEVVTAAPGDVRDALRDLNAHRDVVYAERDRPIHAAAAGPDEYFDDLWGLDAMDVPEAWAESVGAGRTVAVVDTGVDRTHPDLRDNLSPGWDFVGNDPYPDDGDGHGTHVAGTIAAEAGNTIGVAGVAPQAKILPLRVLDDNGVGYVSDAVEAYNYAADRGVAIVNASLGGVGKSTTERAAIDANRDVLFVVAAGNSGALNEVEADDAEYPCSYGLANVLCVGASRQDDGPAEYSNYGHETVDVFAPGGDWDDTGIWSTTRGGGYGVKYGTSMATPHVAGLAAALLSRDPGLTPEQTVTAVVASADGNPLLHESVAGGRANANRALTETDADVDGILDQDDNCLGTANPAQLAEEACAPADDGDGIAVPTDRCPHEAASYAADGCPGNEPGADRDYWRGAYDLCPDQTGPARGCIDTDRDGIGDRYDNCPTVSNPTQRNSDGRNDGGDACDRDLDNDGRANNVDACPTQYALTANGCPAPVPPADSDRDGRPNASDACPTEAAVSANGCPIPSLTGVSAKPRKRGTRRTAKVKVRTNRAAMVRITVQRRKGGRWVKVARKTVATRDEFASYTARRLRRGSHRVVVAVYSSAGKGASATKYFRVR